MFSQLQGKTSMIRIVNKSSFYSEIVDRRNQDVMVDLVSFKDADLPLAPPNLDCSPGRSIPKTFGGPI
jgi:hypothetical protein